MATSSSSSPALPRGVPTSHRDHKTIIPVFALGLSLGAHFLTTGVEIIPVRTYSHSHI